MHKQNGGQILILGSVFEKVFKELKIVDAIQI